MRYGSTSVEQVLKSHLTGKLSNDLSLITIREPELVEKSSSPLSVEFSLLDINNIINECKTFLEWWAGFDCGFELPKMFVANINIAELVSFFFFFFVFLILFFFFFFFLLCSLYLLYYFDVWRYQ